MTLQQIHRKGSINFFKRTQSVLFHTHLNSHHVIKFDRYEIKRLMMKCLFFVELNAHLHIIKMVSEILSTIMLILKISKCFYGFKSINSTFTLEKFLIISNNHLCFLVSATFNSRLDTLIYPYTCLPSDFYWWEEIKDTSKQLSATGRYRFLLSIL